MVAHQLAPPARSGQLYMAAPRMRSGGGARCDMAVMLGEFSEARARLPARLISGLS